MSQLWNWCAFCGKRIETGEKCYGLPNGESVCTDCCVAENEGAAVSDGEEEQEVLTMAERIDRGTAIAKLTALEVTEPNATMADAKRVLADMPVADVVPVVHGRWMPFRSEAAGDIQYCSVCEIGFDAKMAYYPHCGAKMDIKDGGDNDAVD